ncbi:MAG: 4Fe-4S dicluster domain-containing protein [Fimbriimonadaceae bacterium]|nr:4Fe-4S dicluster domain-containing protein [Fimbriimonadaceae bacterium]
MRITTVRVIVQSVSFTLFLALLLLTCFSGLRGFPVSLFLELDPLTAVASSIASRTVYQNVIWALFLLLPTLLLGRFFCNWLCPFGILHQLTGWLARRRTPDKQRLETNRYRPLYGLKYALLVFILVAAVFGSLQNGLLDPAPTIYRSFTVAVLPVVDATVGGVYVRPHYHQAAWLVGALFLLFLGLNLLIPRFYCRVLCPLGAFLGWLARFSLFRIERNVARCTDCDLCLKSCEGACDPHSALRKAECFVCFNCIEDCPEDALRFAWLPPIRPDGDRGGEVTAAQPTRRQLAFGALAGALFVGWARSSGETSENFRPSCIRPPGAVPEHDFLARCIKCDQCIRVCPTNVLQPALLEAGLEGLWTPVMNMRLGYCELNCTLCGQVCPTGAIQRLTLDEKHGHGAFEGRGPVRSGTAFYDRGRCLPWAMDTSCAVCEEVCPVSPKAIFTRHVDIVDRQGQPQTIKRPYIDPTRCIGCGICEHECPVVDLRAVRVSAVGESRSKERSLLLQSGNAEVSAPS